MAEASHAVFLSYASRDAEAAHKIAEALRAGGIEVFLDQSELRGGDAWDQKIRHEIHDCALFIPIVSQHTQERLEGYFRHEWNLAIERVHHMAQQKLFLVPVVVDSTRDQEALVPDAFRGVQWTHLPGGETPPAFVERIKRLLSPLSPVSGPAAAIGVPAPASQLSKPMLRIAAVIILAALAYFVADKFWLWRPPTVSAAFAPPPNSIAVLPFLNMSGDRQQEYFSDGLTEEILNSLARINELQVAARTSSFSFEGQHPDIFTVAHRLNVASVLEGSVRRSGNTVRVTAQLNNAVTGFHLWSNTYDRDLGDVLKLQTDIATAVAAALKVTLLGDVSAKIQLGGTHSPAAFDAYLRASKAFQSRHDAKDVPRAIAAYTEAIQLDPAYALAFAGRSTALAVYSEELTSGAALRKGLADAEADARRAITLAPELAEGHGALGFVLLVGSLDFAGAHEEYERALELAPGNALILRLSGTLAASVGRFDVGLAALHRAVALDPLDRRSYSALAYALYSARRYGESATAYTEAVSLAPDFKESYGFRGFAFYALGDLKQARASCEMMRDDSVSQECLAVVYERLGRRADAEEELAKAKASQGDSDAYQYATISAQWGDPTKALDWLDTAMRLRDAGLQYLRTDPLLDPLRNEPRFQAIERELKFPD